MGRVAAGRERGSLAQCTTLGGWCLQRSLPRKRLGWSLALPNFANDCGEKESVFFPILGGMMSPMMRGIWLMALAVFCDSNLRADDWPQWLGPARDSVWRETGIVSSFPAGGPPVVWRTPISSGYSGPAVAQGRVYVLDHQFAKGTEKPTDAFARGSILGAREFCA